MASLKGSKGSEIYLFVEEIKQVMNKYKMYILTQGVFDIEIFKQDDHRNDWFKWYCESLDEAVKSFSREKEHVQDVKEAK